MRDVVYIRLSSCVPSHKSLVFSRTHTSLSMPRPRWGVKMRDPGNEVVHAIENTVDSTVNVIGGIFYGV